MKRTIVIAIILLSDLAYGQNYQSEFARFFKEGNVTKQKELLENWEISNPKDPELYTSYFNHYFHKAKKEVLSLTKDTPDGEALVLSDSLDQTAGYIGSQIIYNDSDLQNALKKISYGITLFPNRLDMRFGKIYALGEVKDWTNFTSEIIAAVNHSSKNNNNWTWTNGATKEDGKQFFLSTLQSYQIQLYNTERDDLLANMREISLAILTYYPDSVETLSNLSITYSLEVKLDEALESLLQAEKIAPKDYIVLSNIGNVYKQKGNKVKAIEYYEKTALFGDEEAKAFAEKKIAELKE